MNDRYLFRAKRIDNGELVEGALFDGKERCIIGQNIKFSPYVSLECKIIGFEVDQSTICQCTGLRDKNGKLIWENDIVSDECGNMAKIIWNDAELQYLADYEFEPMVLGEWCSVIGNIFDNPELLEVGE